MPYVGQPDSSLCPPIPFDCHRTIMILIPAIASILLLLLYLLRYYRGCSQRNPRRLLLPAGPKPRIFIGNLFDLPKSRMWGTVSKWQKIYGMWYVVCTIYNGYLNKFAGNIIHARILNQRYIFLNDARGVGHSCWLISVGISWSPCVLYTIASN